jgi:hypothetical protein
MSDLKERLREAYRVTSYNSINGCAECGIAANDAMEAVDRIAQLEAAVRPFAEAANGFDAQRINNPEEWFAYGGVRGNHETTGAITVGDLRRARAAWEDRT